MGNLVINFTPVDPAPINGYVVKYRPVGDTVYTTHSPNPTVSPAVIAGVDNLISYEGTIQSDCGSSILSGPVDFTVDPCIGDDKKLINYTCETGTRVNLSSTDNGDGTHACTYQYVFSDASVSAIYLENNSAPCAL